MPIPWNDDPPGSAGQIRANLTALGLRIYAEAARRRPPTVAMAQDWHRAAYHGVRLPVPYYAGELRDSDPSFPELIGYEVQIGTAFGAMSADVPTELIGFEAGMRAIIAGLDGAIPVGGRPGDPSELFAVLEAAAIAHGEWVRIHPLANGNGRIARIWANWVSVRYGLPFFLQLKPRPAHMLYAGAAAASMRGQHRPMAIAFKAILDQLVGP